MNRINEIRKLEQEAHEHDYNAYELFSKDTWLASPSRTVMESLGFLRDDNPLNVLDLGSGVGRNAIPIARALKNDETRIECIDFLELAIDKLQENALKYDVGHKIIPILALIDDFTIKPNSYDLIIGVSSLEHLASHKILVKKIRSIAKGLKQSGVFCLVMNCAIQEYSLVEKQYSTPQFELNLSVDQIKTIIQNEFNEFCIKKMESSSQSYITMRHNQPIQLSAEVFNLIVVK